MKVFFTVAEAANFLRVHPSTIYRWVSTLEIPHFKIMGRILFKESDLVEWVNSYSYPICYELKAKAS